MGTAVINTHYKVPVNKSEEILFDINKTGLLPLAQPRPIDLACASGYRVRQPIDLACASCPPLSPPPPPANSFVIGTVVTNTHKRLWLPRQSIMGLPSLRYEPSVLALTSRRAVQLRQRPEQNGGRNGVFSDGPMRAEARNGSGRKNLLSTGGARVISSWSACRLSAKRRRRPSGELRPCCWPWLAVPTAPGGADGSRL
jgi:hypothetical protein